MRTLVKLGAISAGTVLAVGLAAPAMAAPGDHSNGVGGCIAGALYGNTSNPRPSGHGVLPSMSPGPWQMNYSDPSNPLPGSSLGDLIQEYGFNAGDLREGCPFQ